MVGLGYVGIPVASTLAATGFHVTGLDLLRERVEAINAGASPLKGREPGLEQLLAEVVSAGRLRAETDVQALAAAQVVLVCVDTPVEPLDRLPRYDSLLGACRDLAGVASEGALVVVESTISPGTMTGRVAPIFAGGVRLGHCPERVMPGRLLLNLRTMPRVIGAEGPETARLMLAFYSQFVEGELEVADLTTAEVVKTAENTYRDINIAFANELALICQSAGADVWRVRELVNKVPGRNLLLPGGGVGGHCLPKDPWLLAAGRERQDSASVIAAARAVNDGMPAEVAGLVGDLLQAEGLDPAQATVLVLGFSYLEDSGDVRNSPSAALLGHLGDRGCSVRVHDPFVAEHAGHLLGLARGADCAVAMVGHGVYRELDLGELGRAMRRRLLVDTRRLFEPVRLRQAGFRFRTLGSGAVD